MSRECGCTNENASADAPFVAESPTIFTIGGDQGNALRSSLFALSQNMQLSPGVSFAKSAADLPLEYHFVPSQGALASASSISASGMEFDTIISGSLGAIPIQLRLRGKIDIKNREIEIGLTLLKPIKTSEYVWKFELSGLLDLGNDRYIAKDIVLKESETPDFGALGLDWWCVAKCGGLTILGILIRCLPTLVGGPAAYIACVTAQAGAGAAGIAACIVKECT